MTWRKLNCLKPNLQVSIRKWCGYRRVGSLLPAQTRTGSRDFRIRTDDPLAAPVDDLVEDLQFVRPAQDISDILGFLEAGNAVLVGDEDRLLAIVTSADVSRFIRQC